MTTMETKESMSKTSEALSARSMATSLAIHIPIVALLLLLPAHAMLKSAPKKDIDVVFYRPPEVKIPPRAVPLPVVVAKNNIPGGAPAGGAPAPAAHPRPDLPPGPDGPGRPDLPKGPEESYRTEPQPPPPPKVGTLGLLALKDQFASRAQDKVVPLLGADAKVGAADEIGRPSSGSTLSNSKSGSGGINTASLNRSVGGGGGGAGGGGTGGGGSGGHGAGGLGGSGGGAGTGTGHVSSPILAITGEDRPKSRSGPGGARTDEEIQIVFDRYKASFYRLYNRELRNNPTLKGQMVLRLTIEPDGSVSMCVLQSSDMNAPDLAAQVVSRVKTINFGAKEVPAVTISYPIDFLPAA